MCQGPLDCVNLHLSELYLHKVRFLANNYYIPCVLKLNHFKDDYGWV
jgi:hypothetical protein